MFINEIKNIKSTHKDLRSFGLIIGIVLAVLGGIQFWHGKENYPYPLFFAIIFVLSGLFFPFVLKPFHKVWMAIAVIMGWFMTRVILAILFYLVFTPMNSISRLFGKQFLDLKLAKPQKSYWNHRALKEFKSADCERQF
ncbi:MAG: SxtJ family membrane protein [Candidatus Brocadiales bacterium]